MSSISRILCQNEVNWLSRIFQTAMNYDAVRIHNRPYLGCLQKNQHLAMSPNGHVYFSKSAFQADFTTKHSTWFLHEMVHVWQYQMGYWLKTAGVIVALQGGYRHKKAYDYQKNWENLDSLAQLNFEAQADLIAAYFTQSHIQQNPHGKRLMKDFITNPNNPLLLPKVWCQV